MCLGSLMFNYDLSFFSLGLNIKIKKAVPSSDPLLNRTRQGLRARAYHAHSHEFHAYNSVILLRLGDVNIQVSSLTKSNSRFSWEYTNDTHTRGN